MTQRQQILDFIEAHPGRTNKEVSVGTGIAAATVAAHTSQMVGKKLRREESEERRPNGLPTYTWFKLESPAPREKKARKQRGTGREPDRALAKHSSDIDDLIGALASQLVEQVVQRAKPMLMERLKAELVPALPAPMFTVDDKPGVIYPPAPPGERAKRKRVAVVGLLPQQAGLIQSEFGEVFDFQFPEREDPRGLKHAAMHCAKVYTMTGFIPHAAEEALLSAGGNLVRVSGGMTSLRNKLMEEYRREDQ